jgi:PAS domain S-box-containing protein
MKRTLISRFRYLATLWLAGTVALACATWICFQLGLNPAATSFVYLIVIVLLSLMDSFISSALFSIIAVACLNFFFVEPLYAFHVATASDVAMLAAFLITSLVVTGLVRRIQRLAGIHVEQAQLLNLTHDSVLIRDMDDVITYWNRGAEDLYGWKSEQAVGRIAHQLLQTVFPAPLEQITETFLRDGRWEGELLHIKSDGTKVSVASRWSLQRDESGRPLRTLETNDDLTVRKRAESALRRTQDTYLAEAQQLSQTGSFGWNLSSGRIFWSEETFRIFGYDPLSVPTIELVLQRVHPDDLAVTRQVIDRAARDRQDFDFEHRLLMPDGSVKHLRVVAHPVKDEPDDLQFMGAIMDVTARKSAEEAMRDSEQRYRHLFHHMPIAMFQLDARELSKLFRELRAQGVTDVTGLRAYLGRNPDFLHRAMEALVVNEVNDRSVQMFGGRDASELAGSLTRYWRVSPEAFQRGLETRFRGERIFQEETKVATLDGRVIDVLCTSARLGRADELEISLVSFIDITERARAQAALQQLQANFAHASRISMLGELTALVAHEVNQPLAAVVTNGEAALRWLNRSEPDLAEARESIRSIVDDGQRAGDIIARIRAMAGGRVPKQTALSLHDIIEESMMFLRHEFQSKEVAVSLDLAPALPPVLGDRIQLQQVVVNLGINAVQAMAHAAKGRRQLAIRTMLTGQNTLRCTLEDSGPGIKSDHLTQLFERFFTTNDGGMGMGLPISRSIIEAHGGQIQADNESAFGGARFSFTLPAAADPAG